MEDGIILLILLKPAFAVSRAQKQMKKNNLGGFFENKQQQSKSELIEYNFEKSPTLNVPGDWNSQDEKLLYYEGTIWYEHDFVFHPQPNKRYFLRFNAVNYDAYVSLNDKKLGVHAGGFTPFEFEVTKQLNDGNNFIVIKVNNTRKKENVPTDNFDWWNYGGITQRCFAGRNACNFYQRL